jgi:prolipoprotein diacylglyceryltransferase
MDSGQRDFFVCLSYYKARDLCATASVHSKSGTTLVPPGTGLFESIWYTIGDIMLLYWCVRQQKQRLGAAYVIVYIAAQAVAGWKPTS